MHPQDLAECKDKITTYGGSLIALSSIIGLIICYAKPEWMESLAQSSPGGELILRVAIHLCALIAICAILGAVRTVCHFAIQKDDCCRTKRDGSEAEIIVNGNVRIGNNATDKRER
ncbi:MAG: hypothetical protein U0X86_000086 [Wolbachia endosymbiont of Xenopsylla cheopis]